MSNHAQRRANDPRYEITVKLLPDGKVSVSGPLAKRDLCKEMLKEAIRVVEMYEPPAIVVPENPLVKDLG